MFVRAIWFLLVGWWLSWMAIVVAYAACVTVIGLPLGFWIFNRLPAIITLRPRSERSAVIFRDGVAYANSSKVQQRSIVLRAFWFLLIGWWVGAIWLTVAWLLCITIIGLPIGLMMFNRVGAVMSLLKY